uniref:ribonuclease H n=1 Tax=Leptobrachium leishanense TaxID=445787 RepID=A0A8C5R0W1_9ANUR
MEPASSNQILAVLTEQVSALTKVVQKLQTGQEALLHKERSRAESTALPPSPSGSVIQQVDLPALEPRVNMPERFAGDRTRYRTFITACELMFSLCPRTYGSDSVKVRSAISLLSGPPQEWAFQLLREGSPLLTSWGSFVRAMNPIYDDPLRSSAALTTIRHLKQGRRPVEDYISEFRAVAADTGLNDVGLKDHFRHGLSEQLKDELARIGVPTSLEALITQSLVLDQHFRERRQERLSNTPFTPPRRHEPSPVTSPRPTSSSSSPEPMEIGTIKGPLSSSERDRRRTQNLCLYCGQPGHLLRGCPTRPPRPSERGKSHLTIASLQSVVGSASTHLTIPVTLQWGDRSVDLNAIIDSGASNSFFDLSLATSLAVPTQLKKKPVPLHMVDGSTLRTGPVTHETILLKLLIGTKHQESLQWDIVPSPLFPIVLGLPWLRTHNPYIDWSSNTVSFPSCHCRVHCMNGSNSEKVAFSTYPSSTLPPKYSDFQDVFEKKGVDTLPPHREYDCPIDLLPGAPIPHGRIFNLSVPESQSLKDYIEDSLAKGFIRHSTSPAGAGIFFVGKRDGGLRPCVDYRALNAITVRNRYPLPLIPELLDRVKDACIFTKIDLRGAYNLVRMREGDEWKTAFRSRYGQFKYLVMPFGLCNAPAAFQHFLNDIFRDVLDTLLVVYLDDLLVYSRTIQEHTQHVRLVLSRLRQHKLYGKIEKSTFEKSSIEFLGYVLSPGHIEMDKAKIKAILDWPTPRDKKMVQQFMGFANFYRRFIRSFSHLTAPITSLTKKDVRFCWTEEAQRAFNKLKESFTQAPILKQPDINLPYSLETDASDIALGAILSQKSGTKNLLHPVAFYSRRLTPAEKNYSIGEKELLAIKSALEEWRHLLEGAKHPVVVYTDHRNLEYLRTAKRLRPRQARWALFFARFLLHITYRPGVRNGKADALSRRYDSDAFPSTTQTDSILPNDFFCASQGSLIDNIKKYSLQPPTDIQGLISNDGLFYHGEQIYVP